MAYEPELVHYGPYRESWGYEAANILMSEYERPDALFAANNFIALGVMQALSSLGLTVPDDVALVCFDDLPRLSVGAPFFTASVQPAGEMGRIATRLLLERIEDPDLEPRDVVLPTELVIRGSCGCSPD